MLVRNSILFSILVFRIKTCLAKPCMAINKKIDFNQTFCNTAVAQTTAHHLINNAQLTSD